MELEEIRERYEKLEEEQQSNLNRQLAQAIQMNQLNKVEQLIQDGADVNIADPQVMLEPLVLAIIRGSLPMVKLLVEQGANVNAIPNLIMKVINYTNNLEMVKFLVNNGVLISSEDLTYAISVQADAIAEYLRRKVAPVSK